MALWSSAEIGTVLEADRIDGDYFKPRDLEAIRKIKTEGGHELGNIAKILTGRTPSDYADDGSLVVVRSGDLVSPLIYPSCERPFLKAHPSHNRTALKVGDVLISSIGMGSIGKISLVVDSTSMITVSEVTVVRDAQVPPEFLFAYLSSPIGQSQIGREVTGATGQQHLLKSKVARILIPKLPEGINKPLRDTVQEAYERQEAARLAYTEAEALIELALGMDKMDLTPQLFYERTNSDVQVATRLDAEYYQPKYTTLIQMLNSTGKAVRLGDVLREPLTRGSQPMYAEDGDVPVINSQHVGKTGIELFGCRTTNHRDVVKKAIVGHHDVLLNSTGYVTIGRCQSLMEDIRAVVDGHITIIRPKETINPVFLAAFLNSRAGQLQTEQAWSGSSGQIELRLDTIDDFVVWQPSMSVQDQISSNLKKAYENRSKSRSLLEEAKVMVEESILRNGS